MATSVPTAGRSPFAHLGIARAAEETDDDRKKREDDEREANKKATGHAETDDERDRREDKERKDEEAKKKAEEDEKKEKEAKRAKKAEEDGDDESDRDDEDDTGMRAARRRERGRLKAIVLSDAGKVNPVGAMHLALETSMSRNAAIGMLAAIGAGHPAPATPAGASADPLRSRMATVMIPPVGGGDSEHPAQMTADGSVIANAAAIIAAGKKRRGEA